MIDIPAPIQKIINDLDHFVRDPSDIDANITKIHKIFDGFDILPSRELALPAIFSLIERNPTIDPRMPCPLMPLIESIPGYTETLRESLHRQPATLSIWLVNRLLNAHVLPFQHELWVEELQAVLIHPLAPESTKKFAKSLIEYQQNEVDVL